MKYIVIKNNKIVRVYNTNDGEKGVKTALQNVGIEYDLIRAIEPSEEFIHINESGYYSGYTLPFNGMDYITITPEMKEGFIPRWNGESWEYVQEIIGTWYHKETQQMIVIEKNETGLNIDEYTKKQPSFLSKWNGEDWVFDYVLYRTAISEQLREKCRSEREKFFPDSVKDNILVGQKYDNSMLTIDNYNKLATVYRGIVKEHEPKIMMLEKKEDIDNYFNSIKFPTLEDLQRL